MEGLPGHPVRRPRPRADPQLRRLVLLRHGRTAHNAAGRVQGQLDVPLDEVGRTQAAALHGVLEAEVVVSSDLARASATASAVGLPLQVDERLREQHFGRWQGLTHDEIAAQWPEQFQAWREHRGGPVEGETWAEVGARARGAVDELVWEGTALLVTHGGTARCLLSSLLELPLEHWWRFEALGNTRWSTLVEHPQGWRLAEHNAGVL